MLRTAGNGGGDLRPASRPVMTRFYDVEERKKQSEKPRLRIAVPSYTCGGDSAAILFRSCVGGFFAPAQGAKHLPGSRKRQAHYVEVAAFDA